MALHHIRSLGFEVLEQNWRFRRYEIDILAAKADMLHVIEVKTRTSRFMGYPEANVTDKKLEGLMIASEIYREQHPEWEKIQFDVLSITITGNKTEFLLIEDVFI